MIKIQTHQRTDPHFHFKIKSISPKIKSYHSWGNTDLLNHKILGIVGPRQMTPYGQMILDELFLHSKKYNFATVSGLAMGTDQYAHKLSIQNDIPTIAVLGGGINRFLSYHHKELLQQIIKNGGLIVSEYDHDREPRTFTFPQRNRIIAGLSDLLFIPEAGQKSGSLITADFAHKMQKPIYGTPNNIFAHQHRGLHQYMSQNKIKICADFNKLLNHHFPSKEKRNSSISTPLTQLEQDILNIIQTQNITDYNYIIHKVNIIPAKLSVALTQLEIKGYIHQIAPSRYSMKK